MLQESGQIFPIFFLQNSESIEIIILVETKITLPVTSGNRTAKELVQCMRGGDCEKVNTNFHFSVLFANMLHDGGGDIINQWTLSMLMAVGGH